MRATELLDKLCDDVRSNYALVTLNDTGKLSHHWSKVKGTNPDSLDNTTRFVLPCCDLVVHECMTAISAFCGRLTDQERGCHALIRDVQALIREAGCYITCPLGAHKGLTRGFGRLTGEKENYIDLMHGTVHMHGTLWGCVAAHTLPGDRKQDGVMADTDYLDL